MRAAGNDEIIARADSIFSKPCGRGNNVCDNDSKARSNLFLVPVEEVVCIAELNHL